MLFWALSALAVEPEPEEAAATEEVVVETVAVSPGSRVLDRTAIEGLPARGAMELVRAMPGMHLSAHGGRGKAWQFLYRGFDAQHGSDIAVTVEGVPLNEPSHVHAHGYVDASLLSTLAVERVTLVPGVDRVAAGPFATAAAVDFGVGVAHEGYVARLVGGTDRSGTLTVSWRPRGASAGTFILGEADLGAGVSAARWWRQVRLAAGVEGRVGRADGRLLALAYHGDFGSPGALREDDLEAGRVGLYDGYPGAGKGRSSRVLGLASLRWSRSAWTTSLLLFGDARRLALDQDFTGFFQDALRGDANRQQHDAARGGLRGTGSGTWWVAGHPWRLAGGVEAVWDGWRQRDDRVDLEGVPFRPVSDGTGGQLGFGAWAEAEVGWQQRLRVVPGVRLQHWWQRVGDEPTGEVLGERWIGLASPRLRVEGRPWDRLVLFAGYGQGYRPPRADGGVLGALVRSQLVHGGGTVWPVEQVGLTLQGFWTTLDDEQIFDHVSARFEGQGQTVRRGAELLVEVHPRSWLELEATVTFADGRFAATDEPIAFAPRWMGTLAARMTRIDVGLGALSVGFRGWVLGSRPLPQGFRSQPGVGSALRASWDVGSWSLGAQLDNAFFAPWRDGEFVYASWWDTTRPRSALPVVHVTAGDPTALRLWLEVRL